MLALGAVGSLAPALVAICLAALGGLLTEVIGATLLQRVVPDALRGRALGAIATVSTLAYAAGSFAMPILTAKFGPFSTLAPAGIAVGVAGIIAAVAIGPAAIRAEGPDEALLRHIVRLPIFSGVAPARLEAILARRHLRDVDEGTVVMRQGDPPDRIAIIVTGSFDVVRREPDTAVDAFLRTMGPDEVFGEIGVLTGVPRTATVTARTGGRLLEIDGDDFRELMTAGPGLSSRFLDLHRGPGRPRSTPAGAIVGEDAAG
jgi:MFS family permease